MDGGEEVRIVDSYTLVYSGSWDITKEGIYFIGDLGSAAGGTDMILQFFDFATQKTRQLANLGKISVVEGTLTVSPDGRQLLYTQDDRPSVDITLVENFK